MDFKDFKNLVDSNVNAAQRQPHLFVAAVDKDLLWQTYLLNYPTENQQEHNCNTCRQFVKQAGAIIRLDEELNAHTVWEIKDTDLHLSKEQQQVANALNQLVLSAPIKHQFFAGPKHYRFGQEFNLAIGEYGVFKWEHFCFDAVNFVRTDRNEAISRSVSQQAVLKRALETFTEESVQEVLDLIQENKLYRGEQHRTVLNNLMTLLVKYKALDSEKKDVFCWKESALEGPAFCSIRNTSLGQLLLAISEGTDLDQAVRSYESMVAPSNYRRPGGTITSQRTLEKAKQTLEDLGLTQSLERRHGTVEDIPIQHAFYVYRAPAQPNDIFSVLKGDVKTKPRDFKNLKTISITELVEELLPGSSSFEIYLDPKLSGNLVTLTAGTYQHCPTLFAWDNSVGWSYNNALADSDIKQKVKEAGGNVTGKLRNSLSWYNTDDLDLHLIDPRGHHINFSHKTSPSGGRLDVDMNVTELRRDAVENIVYPDKVPNGEYELYVHNYRKRESVDVGFSAEIEFNGVTYTFNYPNPVVGQVTIALYTIQDSKITFTGGLTPSENGSTGRKLWGLNCNTFHPVKVGCLSPNYWTNHHGNKHYFFFLEGATPEGVVRPLFNEFLKNELTQQHRQVFEVLGSRINLSGKPTLGGLGFSVGSQKTFICRVAKDDKTSLVNVRV